MSLTRLSKVTPAVHVSVTEKQQIWVQVVGNTLWVFPHPLSHPLLGIWGPSPGADGGHKPK